MWQLCNTTRKCMFFHLHTACKIICGGVLVQILVTKLLLQYFPTPTCVQPPGNSFQIVVATDGTQSFAIILFGEVNFAPTSATYTTSITTTGALRATHWIAPYRNNVTQAPFMMQHSYTPGVYVINIIDYNSPQQVTTCEENLRTVACNTLKLSGSVQPQACISTGPVCVP